MRVYDEMKKEINTEGLVVMNLNVMAMNTNGCAVFISYMNEKDDIEKELKRLLKIVRGCRDYVPAFGGTKDELTKKVYDDFDSFVDDFYTTMTSNSDSIAHDLSSEHTRHAFATLDLNPTCGAMNISILASGNGEIIREYRGII